MELVRLASLGELDSPVKATADCFATDSTLTEYRSTHSSKPSSSRYGSPLLPVVSTTMRARRLGCRRTQSSAACRTSSGASSPASGCVEEEGEGDSAGARSAMA